MKTRVILITGRPGVGKTTVVRKVAERVKAQGLKVGGMISTEIREKNTRVGFEMQDLLTGERGILAHVNISGPKIGKYKVSLEDLKKVGASSISRAIDEADVVVIDEIGPMELLSQDFKDSVRKALNSTKIVISTIHYKCRDNLITATKNRRDAKIYEVTVENRDKLPDIIANEIINYTRR